MENVSSERARRKPKCARCRNHGFVVELRGHVGRCRFSECGCWKCALITERTRIIARHKGIKKGQRDEEHERAAGVGSSSQVNGDPGSGDCRERVTESLERGTDTEHRRESHHLQQDYFRTEIPQNIVYSGDVTMAVPFHQHVHYANTHPAFLFNVGAPPFGVVGFPHVPQAALMEPRQEAPGFFYTPYLFHPKPDLYQQHISERVDGADVPPQPHRRDSRTSEDD